MADEDQSIDDQADTATGGLTNDMPGLPMSPPGRGPSALGGIAQAFARMMGGAPPPPPPQPGRSPFQFPGQSQVPVQPRQRWQGTTASLALPRGAQQPPARFTPFMRGTPTTSHKQWGQIEPFPNLPQSFENPSIYQGLSKFFGQNGSAAIIPLALSMGKNAGAFLEGVRDGQEWKAKMHREKLEDDARELELKQAQEISEYYNIVDEYETASGAGKAGDVGNYAINGVTMLDALGQKATQLGDDQLLGVLGTGSVEKALQFIHRRNDNWQTLAKANQKSDEQAQQDIATFGEAAPGDRPAQGQGNGARNEGVTPSTYFSTPVGPDGAAPATGKPPPSMVKNSPSPQGGPNNFDWGREKDNPGLQEMIKEEATGRGDAKQIKTPMGPYIMKRAADLNDWVKSTIARDPNIGPDWTDDQGNIHSPVQDALKAAGLDQLASDTNEVAYYSRGLGGGQTGGGGGGGPEQNYNSTQEMLAKKMRPFNPAKNDPGWVQHFYSDRQKFTDNTNYQTTLRRVQTTSEMADEVIGDSLDLPKEYNDPVSFQKAFKEAYDTGTGDERVVRMANAWHRYQAEVNTLIRGGQGGITETMANDAVVPSYMASPAAYRSVIIQDARMAQASVNSFHSLYDKIGGGPMPGSDPKAERDLAEIASMEPVHMAKPGTVILGKEWPDGRSRKWLGPFDTDKQSPRYGELRRNPRDWWQIEQPDGTWQ